MDLVKAVNLGYCTVQWKWKVSMEPNKLRLQHMRSKASQPWPQVRCTNDGILWVSKKMPHPSYNDPRYLLKVWSIAQETLSLKVRDRSTTHFMPGVTWCNTSIVTGSLHIDKMKNENAPWFFQHWLYDQ